MTSLNANKNAAVIALWVTFGPIPVPCCQPKMQIFGLTREARFTFIQTHVAFLLDDSL